MKGQNSYIIREEINVQTLINKIVLTLAETACFWTVDFPPSVIAVGVCISAILVNVITINVKHIRH